MVILMTMNLSSGLFVALQQQLHSKIVKLPFAIYGKLIMNPSHGYIMIQNGNVATTKVKLTQCLHSGLPFGQAMIASEYES
jgi:hypothetical protein